MPGNHGLRLHDDQGFAPALPQPAEDNPEAADRGDPVWAGGLRPFEDGELLAKSDGFQGRVCDVAEKGTAGKLPPHRLG